MGDRLTRTRPVSALPATQRRPYLEFEDGTSTTRRVALVNESTIVGRTSGADLRLDVDGVSRKHARISRVGQALSLVDLGSKNGTFLNGERVDVAALHHGDQIQLGPVTLRFVLAEPDGPTADTTTNAVLVARLSPREHEVATHVAKGLTNPEIAEVLGVSRRTVATHLERVYARLDIHTRVALANLVT
ncbi:MAG: FHA domain-containing protein, partial [Nannocystaceae bacterium]|nr:FHA domain-containing protein [Nannocystaceae bacterium]